MLIISIKHKYFIILRVTRNKDNKGNMLMRVRFYEHNRITMIIIIIGNYVIKILKLVDLTYEYTKPQLALNNA